MARTGGGREECAHDSHLTRAVDARHAARSYEAGLEPCVNAISTSTPPTAGSPARARRRSRATGPLAATHGRVRPAPTSHPRGRLRVRPATLHGLGESLGAGQAVARQEPRQEPVQGALVLG